MKIEALRSLFSQMVCFLFLLLYNIEPVWEGLWLSLDLIDLAFISGSELPPCAFYKRLHFWE